jgi:hypothetical protein
MKMKPNSNGMIDCTGKPINSATACSECRSERGFQTIGENTMQNVTTAKRERKVVTTATDYVTLNMSPAEAETLVAILESVGGPQNTSRRKHVHSILKALSTCDLDPSAAHNAMDPNYRNLIYFKEEISQGGARCIK